MQKRFLLLAAIVTVSLASHAQVEKKDLVLGGTFNFNTSSTAFVSGTSTSSNTNLRPELGLAIGKNSIIGIRGGLSVYTNKDQTGSKTNNTNWMAGAFWRKLFPINEKVGWFTDIDAAYARSIYDNPFNTSKVHTNGFSASFTPGFYFKPSRKILLNASVGGLAYGYSKNESNYKSSSFEVNLLNYYSVGINFIINKDRQM